MTSDNPFSNARREAQRYQDEYALDIAQVVETADNSQHLVKVQVLEPGTGQQSEPFGVPVLTNINGDVNIPDIGNFVIIGYTRGRVPFILGSVYKASDNVPNHAVCDRVLGHWATESEIRFNCDGSIDISATEVNIDGFQAGINVEQDGTTVVEGATAVNFTGATVADDGDGTVTVDIPESSGGGSGSGSSPVTVEQYENVWFERDTVTGSPEDCRFVDSGNRVILATDGVYIGLADVTTPYDLSTITNYTESSQITTGAGDISDIDISSDGTKILTLTYQNVLISYELSTPWDLSTLSETSRQTLNNNEAYFAVKPDGTRIFTQEFGATTRQWDLSTPWEASSATETHSFVPDVYTYLFDMKDDGEIFYMYAWSDGEGSRHIYECELTTAWDLTTFQEPVKTWKTSYNVDTNSFTIAEDDSFILTEYPLDIVVQYLPETTTVSGGSSGFSKSIAIEETIKSMYVSDDGTTLYTSVENTDTINVRNISTPYDIITTEDSFTSHVIESGQNFNYFIFSNNGSTLYTNDSSYIRRYSLSTPWDLSSTITFEERVKVASVNFKTQDRTPLGIAWNNDGTKLYEVGSNSDLIYEYDVSTAFDISSTLTFSQSIPTQDTGPQGIAWNNNGTKLYEVGSNSDSIYEYDVSTAFDISTATFSQSISTQDAISTGIAWNNDGTKLYEVGTSSDLIYEYDVSTAFDISTATFSQSINAQNGAPQGIAWNNNGTKLYEVGSNPNLIYEYDVSTAFDISTATFSQSTNTQNLLPTDIAWNNDGTKLYDVGANSELIYEYNVSTAFDISAVGFISYINSMTISADETSIYLAGGLSSSSNNPIIQLKMSAANDLSMVDVSIETSNRPNSYIFQRGIAMNDNNTIYADVSTEWSGGTPIGRFYMSLDNDISTATFTGINKPHHTIYTPVEDICFNGNNLLSVDPGSIIEEIIL